MAYNHISQLAEWEIRKQQAAENEKLRKFIKGGLKCEAHYAEDDKYYPAVVNEVLPTGKFVVTYTEYGNQVPFWSQLVSLYLF